MSLHRRARLHFDRRCCGVLRLVVFAMLLLILLLLQLLMLMPTSCRAAHVLTGLHELLRLTQQVKAW